MGLSSSLTGFFGNIKISMQVVILALISAVFLVVVSFIAITGMGAVGREIVNIAEKDIPMTEIVTSITAHQFEQAINFERALRYGGNMASDSPAVKKNFHHATAVFEKIAKEVDEEILLAEELLKKFIATTTDVEQREEFEKIEHAMEKIEKEHGLYDNHAENVFKLLEAGYIYEAIEKAEAVEEEEERLDRELEALLFEVNKFTEESARSAEEQEKATLTKLWITVIASLISSAFLTYLIGGLITHPLTGITSAIEAVADGNLDIEVPAQEHRNELGSMARALIIFKEKLAQIEKMEKEHLEAEMRATREQKQAMLDMADSFDSQVGELIKSLASASTELQSTAESMTDLSTQTREASQSVAAASEETSTNVTTVAAAMEEMTASSSEIASQVAAASTKSADAASDARDSNVTVNNLNGLVESIGEVVVAISDIAEQTNLLALNATIEAARAGDAGKGFAVVADEVKKLATETAKKTDEINARITEIQAATTESVTAMERIITNISDIDSTVFGISAAVEEQNATSSEIARNVSEAAQATQQVTSTIHEVQKNAGETGDSAGDVLVAAGEVSKLSEELRGNVTNFLDNVRNNNSDTGNKRRAG